MIKVLMIHCRVDPEDKTEYAINEGIALVDTYGAKVIGTLSFNIRAIAPSTYISKGQVDKVKEFLTDNHVDFIFWNKILIHRNHRALESELQMKVHDRGSLILEIFKARAKSSEEKLQIELAQREYEKSKLVRAWTHLERQRGSTGTVGGPGEKQIELDMQLLKDKIKKLKNQISDFATSRREQRKHREDIPLVALVGYTNVGKTTLFNELTHSQDLAENKLFATLGSHTKKMKYDPNLNRHSTAKSESEKYHHPILISDTVGLIRNFPASLSNAFATTLEEIKYAKLILHIRDISMPNEDKYSEIILKTLKKIGADHLPRWNIWSKWDIQEKEMSIENDDLYISVKTGFNMNILKERIIAFFNQTVDQALDDIPDCEES